MTADASFTFVMAGGGTGGHVVPLVAVARELVKRGHKVLFFGTRAGSEAKLVPAAGFEIEWIEIGGLKRVSWRRFLETMWQLPLATWRVFRRLGSVRPAAVFSMGGFAAGPVVLAALARRLPVVIMEPNAMPGFTNRAIGRWVERALLGMREAERFFPAGRGEVTGVPVRDAFFQLAPKAAEAELTVLITGGSQGSRTLNEAFRGSWPLFREAALPVRFIHQCGAAAAGGLEAGFAASGLRGEVQAFLPDMPAAFARADLVVGRAGANATAELCAAAKPSVLVPFPYAADDHQRKNAQALASGGAARLVPDAEMNGQRLFYEVQYFSAHREELARMSASAKAMAKPGAAQRAAEVLENAARRRFAG